MQVGGVMRCDRRGRRREQLMHFTKRHVSPCMTGRGRRIPARWPVLLPSHSTLPPSKKKVAVCIIAVLFLLDISSLQCHSPSLEYAR